MPNTLWNENYSEHIHTKKDIKIRWNENDTQRAQTHTHTKKTHILYMSAFFLLANVLRCFDASARKKIAL